MKKLLNSILFIFISFIIIFIGQNSFLVDSFIDNLKSEEYISSQASNLSSLNESHDIYFSIPNNVQTEISNSNNKNKELGFGNYDYIFILKKCSLKNLFEKNIINISYIVHNTFSLLEYVINTRAP